MPFYTGGPSQAKADNIQDYYVPTPSERFWNHIHAFNNQHEAMVMIFSIVVFVAILLLLCGVKNPIAKRRFKSPANRLGAVILFVGGVLCLISFLALSSHRWRYGLSDWFDVILSARLYYLLPNLAGKIGLVLMLYGFITAYFYDATLGKLKAWINGK